MKKENAIIPNDAPGLAERKRNSAALNFYRDENDYF
jgi:hypothetical protein